MVNCKETTKMKLLNRFIIVSIILVLSFINSTCGKQKLFETVVWEGYVRDSVGKPIQGVTLALEGCYQDADRSAGCGSPFTIGTSTTDATGHFYIKGKAARSGWYCPTIEGPMGYNWNSSTPVQAFQLQTSKYTNL